MKTLILFSFLFFVSYNTYSQHITNTVGTDGNFSVKDGSDTLLTLRQSDGLLGIKKNISLEYSQDSQIGIIFKGSRRFLHDYYPFGAAGCNTFLGLDAGNFTMLHGGYSVPSSYNTGIGCVSLNSLTTGHSNTAVGYCSLYLNTTGHSNTAMGYSSLWFNTTGIKNTAVGLGSLAYNTTGNYNTAVGVGSLLGNTTGFSNTAVGFRSLYENTTGYRNTAIGDSSLYENTTGAYNTAVGYRSLLNSTGSNNTAIGVQSLVNTTTGYSNTAIGNLSGATLTTGHNNTLIGYFSLPSSGTVSNEITLGNSSITSLRCKVTSITSLSDARDKKNIDDLSLGLDFIIKLKPRQFNWDRREWYEDNKSDGSKIEEKLTAGFIAQELDEVQQSENVEWMDLVYKSNPEKLEATTGNLLPVMVKAIQELNVKNETLEKEIQQLKKENESLKTVNNKLAELEKLIMEMKSNDNKIKEIKSSSN